MARVTVEDCLAKVKNRFALTVLGARRARALCEDRGQPLVDCDNKQGVVALREIARGRVRYREDVEGAMREFIDTQRRQLRIAEGEHLFLEAASLRAMEEGDLDLEPESDEVEEVPVDPEKLNLAATAALEEADDDAEEATVADPPDAVTLEEALDEKQDEDEDADLEPRRCPERRRRLISTGTASCGDVPWCREAAGARLATVREVVLPLAVLLLAAACGDRAPPPLWPAPPPPTLAKPIGQEPPAAGEDGGDSRGVGEPPAAPAGEDGQGRGDPPAVPVSDPESGAVSIDGSDHGSFRTS